MVDVFLYFNACFTRIFENTLLAGLFFKIRRKCLHRTNVRTTVFVVPPLYIDRIHKNYKEHRNSGDKETKWNLKKH